MSDQVQNRVDELLTEAGNASGAALSNDDSADGDSGARSLGKTAREASSLLESTAPRELLAAVGLDTLPDGREPETIPEAIANGDPESVDELKRLLTLAKLANRTDDDGIDDAADSLRESIEAEASGEAPPSDDEADRDGDSEAIDDAAGEPSSESESKSASESEDTETGGIEEQLRSTLADRFEQFGDDVSGLQEQLQSVAESATDGDSTATDEQGTKAADEADEGETDQTDDESEDEGGLFGSDQGGRFGSSESSRHSTMAPPPSERADMRAVKRHSTMPDKN